MMPDVAVVIMIAVAVTPANSFFNFLFIRSSCSFRLSAVQRYRAGEHRSRTCLSSLFRAADASSCRTHFIFLRGKIIFLLSFSHAESLHVHYIFHIVVKSCQNSYNLAFFRFFPDNQERYALSSAVWKIHTMGFYMLQNAMALDQNREKAVDQNISAPKKPPCLKERCPFKQRGLRR